MDAFRKALAFLPELLRRGSRLGVRKLDCRALEPRGRCIFCAALGCQLTLGILAGFAQPTGFRVVIITDDAGKGVMCQAWLITPTGTLSSLGSTDQNGRIAFPARCAQGYSLKAKPRSPNYYLVKKECPFSDKKLVATSKAQVAGLWETAGKFEREGDPAKAALLYNELMKRAEGVDPQVAASTQQKVYQLFASALAGSRDNVSALLAFDSDQGKTVLSPKGKARVSQFQKANRLKPNGQIDYPTLAKAAGSNIGAYLVEGPSPHQQ